MAAIEIVNLKKRYATGRNSYVDALKGISLEIGEGEIFGYIGPNGSGKTTTIKILLDFIPFTEGDIKIMGHNYQNARFQVRIGYMPEDHSYYPHLRVKDFLGFLSGLTPGVNGKTDRTDKIIEEFKLEKVYNRRMGDISLGWRQKVALSAAFIDDPQIIILDEPTSGLDPVAVEEFSERLEEGRKGGKTILFSSHQLSEVERIADRIGILSEGKMLTTGTLDELLAESGADSLNELFLGSLENK